MATAQSGAAHVRAMSPGDIAAAARLSAAFKWPHRPADWLLMLELGHGVAAMTGAGDLAGTALWWPHGAAAATVGMVLVNPDVQRRGLGRAMMDVVLEATRGRALMLNATAAGRRLYDALAFVPLGRVAQYQGEARGAIASPRVRAARPSDRAAILALDERAFGFPRLALLDRLMAIGATLVLEGGDGICGFVMRRPFGRGHLVGPVVAPDRGSGLELIRAGVLAGYTRVDTTDLSEEADASLAELGLKRTSTALPMVRDGWPAPDPHCLRFALASQAYG